MGIGKIIGGALVGIGTGLEQQTILNEKQRAADLENERNIALENLRTKNRRGEMGVQADYTDRNNARNAAREFGYDTKKTEQKHGYDKEMAGVDQANKVAIEKLQHGYRLSEDAAKFKLEAEQSAKEAGTYIDHYEVGPDGAVTGWTKTGKSYRSPPGVAVPKSSGDDDEGGTISAAREGRSGGIGGATGAPAAPQAKTAPQGQKPNWTPADENVLRTRYANATPQTAPRLFRNGKKIPLDEVRRMMQGQ